MNAPDALSIVRAGEDYPVERSHVEVQQCIPSEAILIARVAWLPIYGTDAVRLFQRPQAESAISFRIRRVTSQSLPPSSVFYIAGD